MTRSTTRPIAALLAVCGLAAVGGGALAVRSFGGGEPVAATAAQAEHAGPHGIGEDVLTSFGAVSVDVAKKIPGLTAKALGGVTHYPSYIPPDKMQVQLTVTVTNLAPTVFTLRPGKLFRLVSGDGTEVVATTSNFLRSVELQPSAHVEGVLGFVVPAKGQRLQVRVADPSGPVQTVDIGSAVADPTGRDSATPADHGTDSGNHPTRSGRP